MCHIIISLLNSHTNAFQVIYRACLCWFGLVWFGFSAPLNNAVIKLLVGVLDRIHSILFLCLFWQFKSCFCIVWFCFATGLNIFSYVYSSVFIFFFMSCLSIFLFFFFSDICRNYLDIRNINSLFVTNIANISSSL